MKTRKRVCKTMLMTALARRYTTGKLQKKGLCGKKTSPFPGRELRHPVLWTPAKKGLTLSNPLCGMGLRPIPHRGLDWQESVLF